MKRNAKDFIGKKYGFLTILSPCENMYKGISVLVRCDCGTERKYCLSYILNGHNISCGCKRGKSTIHNLSTHPLYIVHRNMISRCFNKNNSRYNRYGGRGIFVCQSWKEDFVSFYNWAINSGWMIGLEIDREDNSKGYSPENCRVVSRSINQNNKDNNRVFFINGERFTLTQLATKHGKTKKQLWARLNSGWDLETSLNRPIG